MNDKLHDLVIADRRLRGVWDFCYCLYLEGMCTEYPAPTLEPEKQSLTLPYKNRSLTSIIEVVNDKLFYFHTENVYWNLIIVSITKWPISKLK